MDLSKLSPAMLAALTQLAAGTEVDGRSWRAIAALKKRDLVVYIPRSPYYVLTASGIKALAK